jgi:hypothetical protein
MVAAKHSGSKRDERFTLKDDVAKHESQSSCDKQYRDEELGPGKALAKRHGTP